MTLRNRCSRMEDSHILINGGSDICTLGENWLITHRFEHANIYLQGPSELGEEVAVKMDTVTGVTKVQSTTRDVLLHVYQGISTPLDSDKVAESLINPDQV